MVVVDAAAPPFFLLWKYFYTIVAFSVFREIRVTADYIDRIRFISIDCHGSDSIEYQGEIKKLVLLCAVWHLAVSQLGSVLLIGGTR